MDATQLEELLVTALKKVLHKDVSVVIGPAELGKYSGVRPEVFVHFSEFLDFDGKMPDGSTIARYPVKGTSAYRGFQESRPAQLILSVTIVESAYPQLKVIANLLVPTVLLTLESVAEFSLGQLENGSVKLDFTDLQRALFRSTIQRTDVNQISVLRADYEYKIRGFLNVWVTKRGGLKTNPGVPPARKVKPKSARAVAKPKTRAGKASTVKTARRKKNQ